MQHRRRTGSRRCWDRQSARACSWCRWMRCAAGGATATCSPTCCTPVCRRNSLARCRNYTGPPPGQTSTVWPMTRCGRRGGHRERRGRRELGWARELADLALDEEGHRRPAASRPRRPGPGRWADQPGPFDRAARYLGGRCRMPVPEHAEIALYRTAGETLQNVVKARAGRPGAGQAALRRRARVPARVDDGCGFAAEARPDRGPRRVVRTAEHDRTRRTRRRPPRGELPSRRRHDTPCVNLRP